MGPAAFDSRGLPISSTSTASVGLSRPVFSRFEISNSAAAQVQAGGQPSRGAARSSNDSRAGAASSARHHNCNRERARATFCGFGSIRALLVILPPAPLHAARRLLRSTPIGNSRQIFCSRAHCPEACQCRAGWRAAHHGRPARPPGPWIERAPQSHGRPAAAPRRGWRICMCSACRALAATGSGAGSGDGRGGFRRRLT